MNKWILVVVFIGVMVPMWYLLSQRSSTQDIMYRNNNHHFTVSFPQQYDISRPFLDDPQSFWGCFEIAGKQASFCIKVNMNSEFTPPFLTQTSGCPLCSKETETTFLRKKTKKSTYSTYTGSATDACPLECSATQRSSITNEHSVEMETCVDEKKMMYSYRVPSPGEGYSEQTLVCNKTDPLYRLALICTGDQWQGDAGAEACSVLFDQISSTFSLIE